MEAGASSRAVSTVTDMRNSFFEIQVQSIISN
jgi:hypothetical protein